MNRRLSKSEEKYRKKFICEYRFNKNEQRIFDTAKIAEGFSFKEVYLNMKKGKPYYYFMFKIAGARACRAFSHLGSEAEKLADYMHKFKSLEAASTDNNDHIPMLRPGVTVVRC